MVDVAIDAVLVDAFREQLGDDKVNLRTRRCEGEAACIGHHTTIDGDGEVFALFLELSELPHDAKHDFAGATGFRVRDGELSRHIRVEMMVDEHNHARSSEQGGLHLIDTTGRVEVETEHEIGNLQEQVALFAMFVVADDLLGIRQPLEKVGKLVGNDDRRFLALATEEFCPSETRSDSIAVRAAMAGDDDVLTGFNQSIEPTALLWIENIDVHLKQLVRIDALIYELLDACHSAFTVGSIGDAEPF